MNEAVSPGLRRFRAILWGMVLAAAVVATLMFFLRPVTAPNAFGGDFALQSTRGGTFTQENLKGQPSAVFFGYTYCPDVCPTTLAELTALKESLGPEAEDLQIVFVTVDPERDTMKVISDYISAYSDDIIGLSGDVAGVEQAKKAFGAFSEKAGHPDDPNYLVNHTASVFLINDEGGFEGTIAYGEDSASADAKLKRLIEA